MGLKDWREAATYPDPANDKEVGVMLAQWTHLSQ